MLFFCGLFTELVWVENVGFGVFLGVLVSTRLSLIVL